MGPSSKENALTCISRDFFFFFNTILSSLQIPSLITHDLVSYLVLWVELLGFMEEDNSEVCVFLLIKYS